MKQQTLFSLQSTARTFSSQDEDEDDDILMKSLSQRIKSLEIVVLSVMCFFLFVVVDVVGFEGGRLLNNNK